MELLATVAAVAFGAGYLIGDPNTTDETDHIDQFLADELQAAKDRYATTEVDDEENLAFEVMLLERPGTERIMREAVTVDGVGPETALAIAKHFEGDYHEYRAADVETLQRVNGVGENRARALAG
jgi:NAD-dependent DNA ligase